MKKIRVVLAACAGVALSMSVGASLASAAGGTISGTVKYDGTAPAPKPVEVTKDKEVCGLHQHFVEDLIVGSDGGIDRKSTRLNSSHLKLSRMPSSA